MGFPERLAYLRAVSGLTQTALAEGITTPGYISLLEAGRRTPSNRVLRLLAQRLGVTTPELLDSQACDDPERARRVAAAELALRNGDIEAAATRAREIIDDPEQCTGHVWAAQLLLAQVAGLQGERRAAIEQLEQLRRNSHVATSRLQARCAYELVQLYRMEGDLRHSCEIGERFIIEGEQLEWPLLERALLLSVTAAANGRLGDITRANLLNEQAMQLLRALNPLDAQHDPLAMAKIAGAHLAAMARSGAEGEALQELSQLLAVADVREAANALGRLRTIQTYSLLRTAHPDLELARRSAEQAFSEIGAFEHDGWTGYPLLMLARIDLLEGKYEAAETHALAALERLSKIAEIDGGEAAIVYATVLLRLGRKEEAQAQLEAAAELGRRCGRQADTALAWRMVGRVYGELGDHAAAAQCYEYAYFASTGTWL